MAPSARPRLFVDHPASEHWRAGSRIELSARASRHAQVLRLQPDHGVTLFDGLGGQWEARITRMGRQSVEAELVSQDPVERELAWAVRLAVCMPANDRMDDLVEKATELGVAAVVPLMSERSVLRLEGERSLKKQAHWQAVAVAACEQSGRNRVPEVSAVMRLVDFLQTPPAGTRWMLSLGPSALPMRRAWEALGPVGPAAITLLSGPEGGLSPDEQALAERSGFAPIGLGSRVLRADTAPLAALATLAALSM